jgi:hypothetical protein
VREKIKLREKNIKLPKKIIQKAEELQKELDQILEEAGFTNVF